MKKLFAILLSLSVVTIWTVTLPRAQDLEINQPPGKFPAAVFDLIMVKPLLTVGALCPTAAFVGSLPVTYILERDLQASQLLVDRPWRYVADRPLGIFFPGKSIPVRIDERVSEQYSGYFILGGVSCSPLSIK